MTLLAVYFQLASSNYSYIVELCNKFNSTLWIKLYIHWTNFPTLLLFISLNAWANTWCIFLLTESHFKLGHVYFQQNLWIFVYTTVIIDQDQGAPPPSPHRSLCRSGWFFSPLCFKRKCLPAPSHMCSVHFKWSVMKFLIVWFDQNLWLPDHKDSGHKKQSKDS